MKFFKILSDTPLYFCDGKSAVSISGNQYYPIIKDVPEYRKQEDILKNDKPAKMSGELVVGNGDNDYQSGILDNIDSYYIRGKDSVYYIGPETVTDESELTLIDYGYVENYRFGANEIRIKIQSKRFQRNPIIPANKFNTTDFPNIQDDYIGKVVPELSGKVYEIPCTPISGAAASTTVRYKACEFLTDLGTAMIKVGDIWQAATTSNISLSSGEFDVSNAKDLSTGEISEVKLIEPTGYSAPKDSDHIKVFNELFLSIPYDSDNYNTEEWESEELLLGSSGVYINEEIEFLDQLYLIQRRGKRNFRYDFDFQGKRTIRVDYNAREKVGFIQNRAILNLPDTERESEIDYIANKVVIKYNKSYVTDIYDTSENTDGATQAANYGSSDSPLEYTFEEETYINNSSDAATRAEEKSVLTRNPIDTIDILAVSSTAKIPQLEEFTLIGNSINDGIDGGDTVANYFNTSNYIQTDNGVGIYPEYENNLRNGGFNYSAGISDYSNVSNGYITTDGSSYIVFPLYAASTPDSSSWDIHYTTDIYRLRVRSRLTYSFIAEIDGITEDGALSFDALSTRSEGVIVECWTTNLSPFDLYLTIVPHTYPAIQESTTAGSLAINDQSKLNQARRFEFVIDNWYRDAVTNTDGINLIKVQSNLGVSMFRLVSRGVNFGDNYLLIRVYYNDGGVDFTNVIFYPQTQSKITLTISDDYSTAYIYVDDVLVKTVSVSWSAEIRPATLEVNSAEGRGFAVSSLSILNNSEGLPEPFSVISESGDNVTGSVLMYQTDPVSSARIYDIFDIELILGMSDVDSGTVQGREFLGTKLCKVIEIEPIDEYRTDMKLEIIGDSTLDDFLIGDDGTFVIDETGIYVRG